MAPAFKLAVAAIAICAVLGSACGGRNTNAPGEAAVIKIDGSSTVFPITEAVAEEFQREQQGKVNVTVGISGTGGGFKKFVRGEIDVADASRPILTEEMAQAKANGVEYIELPIAFDALTVVVNPQNDWVTSMTVAELKKIWEPDAQGKITHWNQIRPEWPAEKIAAPAPTREPLIILRKQSAESRRPVVVITRRAKTITFWSRVSKVTSSRSAISLTLTLLRTAAG
jgi:phosphate transport system substrate-binding protein